MPNSLHLYCQKSCTLHCRYQNLDSEIKLLLSTNNAIYYQIVASVKARQGKWDEAQRISLKALFLSSENLDEEILINHIKLYFSNTDKHNKEVVYNTIIDNSVVTLTLKNKIIDNSTESKVPEAIKRDIAIHSDQSIIDKPGEYKFECENYGSDEENSLILKLLGKRGETITLDNNDYIIENIIDIYAYFFRFCLSKLKTDYPGNNRFIYCDAPTIEESMEKLKESMQLLNEGKTKQLEMYNFGNEVGVPISYLSGKFIDSYSEIIISVLNHKDQYLYTGEVSTYENREYVLSLSSIIILTNFNLLDKLEHIAEKCVITIDVDRSIRKGAKESYKTGEIVSSFITMSENKELNTYLYTDEAKMERKTFWAKILQTISKLKIKIEGIQIDDNDIYDIIPEYLLV